jgi:hypothetical protein
MSEDEPFSKELQEQIESPADEKKPKETREFIFCVGKNGCPKTYNGPMELRLAMLMGELSSAVFGPSVSQSYVLLDEQLRHLYPSSLSDIVALRDIGTWENPLFIGVQSAESLLISTLSSRSTPSSTPTFRSERNPKNFARTDLQADDGGPASLNPGQERNRLLARCRSHCQKHYDAGKTWSKLTSSEADELLEMGFREIGEELPPKKEGSAEHIWSKADPKTVNSIKQSFF